jgi:hypothetical protein
MQLFKKTHGTKLENQMSAAVQVAAAGVADGAADAGAGATGNKKRAVKTRSFRGDVVLESKLAKTPIAPDIFVWDTDGVTHSINRTLVELCNYNALDDLWLKFAPELHEHLGIYGAVAVIGNCSSIAVKGELQDLFRVAAAPTIDYIQDIVRPPSVSPGEKSWPLSILFGDALCCDLPTGSWTNRECVAASAQLKQIALKYPDISLYINFWRHGQAVASCMEDAKIIDWPEDASLTDRSWLKNKYDNAASSYTRPGYTDNSGDMSAAAAALSEGRMDEEAYREGVWLEPVDFIGGAAPTRVSSLWFDTPTVIMMDNSGVKANNRENRQKFRCQFFLDFFS